ncbi:hypothetical protein Peur_011752 [Populus x canadensis]
MAFMLIEKNEDRIPDLDIVAIEPSVLQAQYNLIHLWLYRAISNAFDLDSVGFFLGRMLSTMKSGRSFYVGLVRFSLGRTCVSFVT